MREVVLNSNHDDDYHDTVNLLIKCLLLSIFKLPILSTFFYQFESLEGPSRRHSKQNNKNKLKQDICYD